MGNEGALLIDEQTEQRLKAAGVSVEAAQTWLRPLGKTLPSRNGRGPVPDKQAKPEELLAQGRARAETEELEKVAAEVLVEFERSLGTPPIPGEEKEWKDLQKKLADAKAQTA